MSRYKSTLWNMTKENYKVYMDASISGKWVRYQRKWYPSATFFQQYGQTNLNMSEVRIEDPRVIIIEGIDAIKKMVSDGRDKEDVENALTKLREFTLLVANHYTHYHKMPENV